MAPELFYEGSYSEYPYQSLGQVRDVRLTGRVGRQERERVDHGGRAQVEDGAPAARHHRGQHHPRHQGHREGVDLGWEEIITASSHEVLHIHKSY